MKKSEKEEAAYDKMLAAISNAKHKGDIDLAEELELELDEWLEKHKLPRRRRKPAMS